VLVESERFVRFRPFCTRQKIFSRFLVDRNPFLLAALYTGLCLKVKGESKVHWTESSGSGNDRRTDSYWANETYMDEQVYLSGSREFGSHSIILIF